jgi:hypothetical protein
VARKYSNTFAETTLSGSISNSATTITLGATSGLPASFPYTLAIDYGTANVEMVTVTALAGSNLTVTRGQDGTSAQSHTAGARVVHPVSARDLSEPQVHMDASADVHGLASGAVVVGTTSTQTLTNKTISGAANTLSNIADASITGLAAAKVSQPFASLTSTGDVTTSGGKVAISDGTKQVNIGASGSPASFAAIRAAASDVVLSARVTGDTQDRVQVASDMVKFGPGGSTAPDVTLYRSAADTLKTDDSLIVAGALTATGAATLNGGVSTTSVTASGSAAVTGNATVTGTVNGVADVQFNGTSLGRGGKGANTSTAGTVATATTTEVAVASASWSNEPTITFVNGRLYEVYVAGGFHDASGAISALATVRVRKGAQSTAGTQLVFIKVEHATGLNGNVRSFSHIGYVKNTSGSNVATKLSLTLEKNVASTSVHLYGDANIPLIVAVKDIGDTTANAELASIAVSV